MTSCSPAGAFQQKAILNQSDLWKKGFPYMRKLKQQYPKWAGELVPGGALKGGPPLTLSPHFQGAARHPAKIFENQSDFWN